MQLKAKIITDFFVVMFIFLFALLVNQYFGNKGVFPIDSFSHFDTGYRVLHGESPFLDYWTVSGPIIDFFQAFIFFIFGVSWQSYLLNGSLINAIFALLTFKLLLNLGLEKKFAFVYCLCVAVLAYPVSGTPFVDLHSTYLSILAIYAYLFAQINRNNIYWFFLPVLIFFAFFSKQVPATYIFLGILFIFFYNFIIFNLKKNKNIFFNLIISSVICLIVFFVFLDYYEISFKSFFDQYIGLPREIGKKRFFSLNYDFKNLILDFKFIHIVFLSYSSAIIYQLKKIKNFKKTINFNVYLFSLVIYFSLIQHQLLTRNQIYIFFLIPIFASLSHIEFSKIFKNKKKYLNYILLLISLFSVYKYNERFNIERKFHELNYVNFKDIVDPQVIDKKFKGLKWISPNKKNQISVQTEIKNIIDILAVLEDDNENKIVITNFSFISAVLNKSQNGISRWYPGNDSNFPSENSKFFEDFKNFFISILKKKNIKNIYVLFDVDENIVTNYLPTKCFNRNDSNKKIFIKFKLDNNCIQANK